MKKVYSLKIDNKLMKQVDILLKDKRFYYATKSQIIRAAISLGLEYLKKKR